VTMGSEDPRRDDEWPDQEGIIAEIAAENRDSLERIAEGDDKWASLARRILQEGDDER